jgi:MOSC domain-containing protein YiiM
VSPGGVPKHAIAEARVTPLGLEGDAHRYRYHGGPERAVCLFAVEAIDGLVAEGHTVTPGALGENVTTQGLDWAAIAPGAHLLLGEQVVLQITTYTRPCTTIAPRFRAGDFSRVSQKQHPGWSRVYARVLVEGRVRTGDDIRVVSDVEASGIIAAAAP